VKIYIVHSKKYLMCLIHFVINISQIITLCVCYLADTDTELQQFSS